MGCRPRLLLRDLKLQGQADGCSAGWDVGILGDPEQNMPPMKVRACMPTFIQYLHVPKQTEQGLHWQLSTIRWDPMIAAWGMEALPSRL